MTDTPNGRLSVALEDEDGRYHRQTLISWWDQHRLANAKILVVGAGALGNELIKNLALLGVGTVIVIDLDAVENSNLSRCVLFREHDEGAPKAEVVARAARDLNPDLDVISVVGDVRVGLGLQVFAEVDLVLGGLDNREARLHINQACWKTSTPWIDGAIEGLMGTMRAFVPPDSACYECTMGERDHELLAARKACSLLTREQMLEGKVPTTATSASVVAALQVQEAVKLLHRDVLPYEFAGRGVAFNGLTHDSYVVTYPRRDECMSHDTYALADAVPVGADEPFSELLGRARELVGPAAVLDLEQEIVVSMTCASCDIRTLFLRPIVELTTGVGLCTACGADRRLELVHAVDGAVPDLLSCSPREIGLPANDVITARDGMTRRHMILDAPGSAIDTLRAAR